MELKERILKEASTMFVKNGFKAVRMDDIAVGCGVSKRTLYELFGDREKLIKNCLDYYMEQSELIVNERIKGAENIIDEFWLVFDKCEAFRSVNSRFVKELRKFYPKLMMTFMMEHHQKVTENTYNKLVVGVEDGLIMKQIDLKYFAKVVTNYIYGLTIMETDPENEFEGDQNDRLRFAIMIFFRGVTTERGRRYIDEKILKIE